jgi:hypothetical protein
MIVVTQTYKEFELVSRFLKTWSAQDSNIKIVVANSGYPDETSALIEHYDNVYEVPCSSEDYWTGATRRALQFVELTFPTNKLMVICNVDVQPDNVNDLYKSLHDLPSNCMVSLPVKSEENLFYSGLKRRKLNLVFPKKITPKKLELYEIDYAPTRFIFLNKYECGEISNLLPLNIPHYGADFVFTHKLKKGGMKLYTKYYNRLKYDAENTGIKNKIGRVTLQELFFSIKSAHNLRYKYRTYTSLGYSSMLVKISILFYSLYLTFKWFLQKCFYMFRKIKD